MNSKTSSESKVMFLSQRRNYLFNCVLTDFYFFFLFGILNCLTMKVIAGHYSILLG